MLYCWTAVSLHYYIIVVQVQVRTRRGRRLPGPRLGLRPRAGAGHELVDNLLQYVVGI